MESNSRGNRQNRTGTRLPELYQGMTLRVMNPENRLLFTGRVEGLQAGTVQLSEDSGLGVPNVVYNTRVKIRGFSHNMPFTLEGLVSGSTDKYWWVENLRSLQGAEQRAFFRQSANLEGTVMGANRIFSAGAPADGEGIPKPCRIVDLSAGGTMLHADASYQVGDWLLLTGLQIDPHSPPATFSCVVRRVMEQEKGCNFGCEFFKLEGSEREQLIRAVFQFQRKELQDRRSQNL